MQVRFTKTFYKQYKKAPNKIQSLFDRKLKLFLKDEFAPILNNHKLQGEWQLFRSINITGDWRALYRNDLQDYLFVTLGTHSQLYS